MQNFPNFTTQFGTAGLILKEIPYRGNAYIRLGAMAPGCLEAHLKECVSFCLMAGAERVFAAGSEALEQFPLDSSLLEMRGEARVNRDEIKNLFPVTEATAGAWREIYNRLMRPLPHAATLETREEKQIAAAPGTYFVHENGRLLGIGWLEDTKLLAMAAAEKGAGGTVLNTLMSLVEGADMVLEVDAKNERAIRLYERMGFVKTRELTRWHRV